MQIILKGIFAFLAIFLMIEIVNAQKECQLKIPTEEEYLYAPTFINTYFSDRDVHTWKPSDYISKIGKFSDKDDKGVWIFEQVENLKNSYYLRNKHYKDEYLMAQQITEAIEPVKTKIGKLGVFTKKLSKDFTEAFVWQFEKLDNQGLFNIWNLQFKTPMFADKLQSYGSVRKDIFLMSSESDAYNNYFDWYVQCKNDDMPEFI